MSNGLLFTSNITGRNYSITSAGAISRTSSFDPDNLALTEALHKIIRGDAAKLNSSEKAVLAKNFTVAKGDLIESLKRELDITHDNFTETPDNESMDRFDNRPFDSSYSNPELTSKRKNSRDELERVITNLKTILGPENKDAKIIERMEDIKKTHTSEFSTTEDGFTAKINPDLQKEFDFRKKRKDPEARSDTEFGELEDADFWLQYQLAAKKPSPHAASFLEKQVDSPESFDFNDLPTGTNAKQWHSFITGAQDHLPATRQEEPKALLRHLSQLKEINDPAIFEEMLEVTDYELDDSAVKTQMDNFNQMIKDLREKANKGKINLSDFSYNPELQATLEAIQMKPSLPAGLSDQDHRALGAALHTLENPLADFRESNPQIAKAISILGLTGTSWTSRSKESKGHLLTALLREIKSNENAKQSVTQAGQAKPSLAPEIDPTKADPTIMFDRFRDSVAYLHKVIHESGRSDTGKRELEADFVRFMRGGELTKELRAEFGKEGRDEDLAQALNYFSRGIGDSRFNVGLVRSLFNSDKQFNIADIVQRSDNFEDIAGEIQRQVASVEISGNRANIPEELYDASADTLTQYSLNPNALAPVRHQNKEDGSITFSTNLAMLRQLGLQAYFSDGDKAKKIKLKKGATTLPKDFPKKLKELIVASLQGLKPGVPEITDKIIIDEILRNPRIVEDIDAEELTFTGNGAPLVEVLHAAIQEREKNFQAYASHDAETGHTFTQLMAGRDRMIKFSKQHPSLALYGQTPITQPYHKNEYLEMVQAFASDVSYLDQHAKTNIAEARSDDSSLFASRGPTTPPSQRVASTDRQATRTTKTASSARSFVQIGDSIMAAISGESFGQSDNEDSQSTSFLDSMMKQNEEQAKKRRDSFWNPVA